jgi:hypothetical protein
MITVYDSDSGSVGLVPISVLKVGSYLPGRD